jgi:hypothetical protein
VEFSEENVDGGVEGICVSREEDMLVAICFVAECHTFNKSVELDIFNPQMQRQKILDSILSLLEFF